MSLKSAFAFKLTLILIISTVSSEDKVECKLENAGAWPAECKNRGDYKVYMGSPSTIDNQLNVLFIFNENENITNEEKIEKWLFDTNCKCNCDCISQCSKEKHTYEFLNSLAVNSGALVNFPRRNKEAACYALVHQRRNLSSCCVYVSIQDDGTAIPSSSPSSTPDSAPTPGPIPWEIWMLASIIVLLAVCILAGIYVFYRWNKEDPPPLPSLGSLTDLRPVPERKFLFMYVHSCDFSKQTAEALNSILKKVFKCATICDPFVEDKEKLLEGSFQIHRAIIESDNVVIISSPAALKLLEQSDQEGQSQSQTPFEACERHFFQHIYPTWHSEENQKKYVVVGLENFSPNFRSERFFMLPTMLKILLQSLGLPKNCSSIESDKRLHDLAKRAQASG